MSDFCQSSKDFLKCYYYFHFHSFVLHTSGYVPGSEDVDNPHLPFSSPMLVRSIKPRPTNISR